MDAITDQMDAQQAVMRPAVQDPAPAGISGARVLTRVSPADQPAGVAARQLVLQANTGAEVPIRANQIAIHTVRPQEEAAPRVLLASIGATVPVFPRVRIARRIAEPVIPIKHPAKVPAAGGANPLLHRTVMAQAILRLVNRM
jgi:hypothetical protein